MTGLTSVYHADVVGSTLRPPWLVEAREAMRAGKLAPDEYEAVADRAVDQALRIQEAAGVDVVTDGEMRRDFFADLFIHGMEGFSQESSWTAKFHGFDSDVAMEAEIPFTVTEKIKPLSSPTLREFLRREGQDSTAAEGHPSQPDAHQHLLVRGAFHRGISRRIRPVRRRRRCSPRLDARVI